MALKKLNGLLACQSARSTTPKMADYQRYKIICECGGFSSTNPSFKKQHESTQKHQRWIAEKSGGIITATVMVHHRKRLPDIYDCPCGAEISAHKSRHIEAQLHQYYIKHGVQKPLSAEYCRAHRPGTTSPIDTSQCVFCANWHHTKNLLDGKVCRKCL